MVYLFLLNYIFAIVSVINFIKAIKMKLKFKFKVMTIILTLIFTINCVYLYGF
jgi:hypothetical protein